MSRYHAAFVRYTFDDEKVKMRWPEHSRGAVIRSWAFILPASSSRVIRIIFYFDFRFRQRHDTV